MLLVTRAQWGARAPKHSPSPLGSLVGSAFHYEGPHMGLQWDHSACAGKVRGIQAFHMDGRGWNDVAYNALVCHHGYVYEGRGVKVRSAAQGTNDGNAHYVAICGVMGVDDPLTDAMKVAYLDARGWLTGGHGEIQPHSHFHSTGCPGDPVRAWILAGVPTPGGAPAPQPGPGPAPQPGPHPSAYPLVQVNKSPIASGKGTFHGAVWHPEARPSPRWFWQTNYAQRWPEVQEVQQQLRNHGHVIAVDGIGGQNTHDIILDFQRARGLKTDAVVGPATRDWLLRPS